MLPRLLNQRILELEAQIEDLQESQQKSESARSEDHSEIRKRLTEQSERREAAETEACRLRARVEELETQGQQASNEYQDKESQTAVGNKIDKEG